MRVYKQCVDGHICVYTNSVQTGIRVNKLFVDTRICVYTDVRRDGAEGY